MKSVEDLEIEHREELNYLIKETKEINEAFNTFGFLIDLQGESINEIATKCNGSSADAINGLVEVEKIKKHRIGYLKVAVGAVVCGVAVGTAGAAVPAILVASALGGAGGLCVNKYQKQKINKKIRNLHRVYNYIEELCDDLINLDKKCSNIINCPHAGGKAAEELDYQGQIIDKLEKIMKILLHILNGEFNLICFDDLLNNNQENISFLQEEKEYKNIDIYDPENKLLDNISNNCKIDKELSYYYREILPGQTESISKLNDRIEDICKRLKLKRLTL